MPIHVNVGGVWKEVAGVHINVGGVWKECDDVPINVGGVWKTGLLSSEPVNVPDPITFNHDAPGSTIYSGVYFRSDGSIDDIGGGAATYNQKYTGSWHADEPGATGADYDIRCASLTSGTFTNSAASVGTWVSLGTDRRWRNSISSKFSPDTKSTTAEFEIRDATTLVVLASFTVTVTAEN